MFDVLGIGCVAVDDLLFVPRFPAPDEKVRVPRMERHFGGLTGTALVAAARLGARCAFGGLLGTTDPLSLAVEQNFIAAGIDVSPAARCPEVRPIYSIVVVGTERKTRNIFFHIDGASGTADEGVAEDLVRRTRVLFVDQQGMAGAIKAMAAAAAAGVEVVADIERDDDPLAERFMAAVGHLIVPEEFALRITGAGDAARPVGRNQNTKGRRHEEFYRKKRRPTSCEKNKMLHPGNAEAVIGRLWSEARRAVIVTCGERGCWWTQSLGERPGPIMHQPAFLVEVVDTTGCGDVFHGAYAAALAQGRPMGERVRIASAAAALKATQAGGQRGIPTRHQITEFLRQQPEKFAEDTEDNKEAIAPGSAGGNPGAGRADIAKGKP